MEKKLIIIKESFSTNNEFLFRFFCLNRHKHFYKKKLLSWKYYYILIAKDKKSNLNKYNLLKAIY